MVNGKWFKGVFDANKPRADVGAAFGRGSNFGFDETISVPAGKTTVCVVAINVGPGENSLLTPCRDAMVTAPPVVPEPAWRTVVNNGDNPRVPRRRSTATTSRR